MSDEKIKKKTVLPPSIAMDEQRYSAPIPSRSEEAVDRGPEIVASSLAPQLGSDSTVLSQGKVDMRRFSVIDEKDMPFLIYASIRGIKSPVWKNLYDEFLNLKISVGGRGRRDIIRMEGVSKAGLPDDSGMGGGSQPGFFERNITDRGWKKRVKEERI